MLRVQLKKSNSSVKVYKTNEASSSQQCDVMPLEICHGRGERGGAGARGGGAGSGARGADCGNHNAHILTTTIYIIHS